MAKPRKRKRYEATASSARGKGDILERAVASLHEGYGVTIQQDVFLPTVDGSGTREIDILLTADVAGYPVRVAIECKNETRPVGPEKIDAFVGKLDDVGIPRQHGVFVSPTHYTAGALRRAKAALIETLLFEDISTLLPSAVVSAFQSIVYLLLTITYIRIRNDQPAPTPRTGEMLFFRNAEGTVVGGVPDIVWQMWIRGDISETLGSRTYHVETPNGWFQMVNGRVATVKDIEIGISISAHVVTFPGSVHGGALVQPTTHQPTRFSIQADFPRPEGVFPIQSFSQEGELEEWIKSREGVGITMGRFRLPRIRFTSLYWPPSNRAMATLAQRFLKSHEAGTDFNVNWIPIEEIEGSDLSAIWEPIVRSYPFQTLVDTRKDDQTEDAPDPSAAV